MSNAKYEQVKVNVYSVSIDGLTIGKNQKSIPLPYSVGSAYDFGRALVASELTACKSYAEYMHDVCMENAMSDTASNTTKTRFQEKADKWADVIIDCNIAMNVEKCENVQFFRTVAYAVAYAIFPVCRRRHGKNRVAIDDFAPNAFELAKAGNHKELKKALVAMMNSTTSADRSTEWAKGFASKVKQPTVENAVRHAQLITNTLNRGGIDGKETPFEKWTINVVLGILKDTFRFVPAPEKSEPDTYVMTK